MQRLSERDAAQVKRRSTNVSCLTETEAVSRDRRHPSVCLT